VSDSNLGKWILAPYERELPFLEQIPREARDFFILKSHIKEYDQGDMLFPGNTPGEYFYVLQTGRLQVCGENINGKFTEIAILEKGACFGEMSLITENPTSNTIMAIEDSTVLHMSKEDFIRFVTDSPGILILLYKILADRLRAKNKMYETLIRSSLMGTFKTVSFADLAQSLERDKRSGSFLISFDSESNNGIIAFHKGQIYHAEAGDIKGADALVEILTWDDAWFRFDTNTMPKERTIKGQTTGLIMDAARDIDERKRAKAMQSQN
jgi:CRP-like cAMP-binding protein